MTKKCWHKWNVFEQYRDGKSRRVKGCTCVKCGMVRDEGHHQVGCVCKECGKPLEVFESKERCLHPYVGWGVNQQFYGSHSESYYRKSDNYLCERCGAVNTILKTEDERRVAAAEDWAKKEAARLKQYKETKETCPGHIWKEELSPCHLVCELCGTREERHDFSHANPHDNHYTTYECLRPGCNATIDL